MNDENVIQRCKSIRWLLHAHPCIPKRLSLNYILYDYCSYKIYKKLLKNYYEELQNVLYKVIPSIDCANIIIEYANLMVPFYNAFPFFSIKMYKTIKIKFYDRFDKTYVSLS